MTQKAKQKLSEVEKQAAEQSKENETEAQNENQEEEEGKEAEDVDVEGDEKLDQQEPNANEKEANQEHDTTETVNLIDSVEEINSDLECTNSNVADAEQSSDTQPNENQAEETENKDHQIDGEKTTSQIEQIMDKENETVDANDSVELIESEMDHSGGPESRSTEENDDNSSDDVIETTHKEAMETDFTENEAQSMDDNSNDADDASGHGGTGNVVGDNAPPEEHADAEITSTNENDIEMAQEPSVNEETTASSTDKTNDENDCDSNHSANSDALNEVDEIIAASADDIVNEVIANVEEVIADPATVAGLDEEVECIALEETVDDGNGADNQNSTTANETESIFSDLSDCNQLVTEEISNVISTSASLDVAALLNSEDFENISSPEAFNWNRKQFASE